MCMIRISMAVEERVFAALSQAADDEQRELREQASIMIAEGLQQRGLLAKESDITGQDDVAYPSRTGDGVDSIISASAPASTAGGRHAPR